MNYSIEEAIRVLSSFTLIEVQNILGLNDDDIIDILLNKNYYRQIMNWYAAYTNNKLVEGKDNDK